MANYAQLLAASFPTNQAAIEHRWAEFQDEGGLEDPGNQEEDSPWKGVSDGREHIPALWFALFDPQDLFVRTESGDLPDETHEFGFLVTSLQQARANLADRSALLVDSMVAESRCERALAQQAITSLQKALEQRPESRVLLDTTDLHQGLVTGERYAESCRILADSATTEDLKAFWRSAGSPDPRKGQLVGTLYDASGEHYERGDSQRSKPTQKQLEQESNFNLLRTNLVMVFYVIFTVSGVWLTEWLISFQAPADAWLTVNAPAWAFLVRLGIWAIYPLVLAFLCAGAIAARVVGVPDHLKSNAADRGIGGCWIAILSLVSSIGIFLSAGLGGWIGDKGIYLNKTPYSLGRSRHIQWSQIAHIHLSKDSSSPSFLVAFDGTTVNLNVLGPGRGEMILFQRRDAKTHPEQFRQLVQKLNELPHLNWSDGSGEVRQR